MRSSLLIAALLVAITSYGQESNPISHLFQIGINISPDYCYRRLTNDDAYYDFIVDSRDDREHALFGYTAGVNARYYLSSHWGIDCGIQYSKKGFQNNISGLTFGDMIDPRYGFIYVDPLTEPFIPEKFVDNFYYLEMPIRAIYVMGKKKMRFLASLGLMPGMLVRSTHDMVGKNLEGNSITRSFNQTDDFKKFLLSPIVSLGLDYKISDKINLSAEPTFRYGVMKLIDAPVSAHLWSAGLNVAIYYTLK